MGGSPARFLDGIQDMVTKLSPLESTLTRNLGNHFISLDFNPLRIRTYAILDHNSFEMCTYEKGVGGCPPLRPTAGNREAIEANYPGSACWPRRAGADPARCKLLLRAGAFPCGAERGSILVTSFICNFWRGKVFDTMWGSWPGRTSN